MNEHTIQEASHFAPGWLADPQLGNASRAETERNETDEQPAVEMQPETALELVGLGLATLIDVRQPFELECSGGLPCAENVPLLQFKQALGRTLSEEEREILDSDKPDESDIVSFLSVINRHFHGERIVLIFCRTGRRSRYAVELLRSINWERCFSVAGGFQAMQQAFPDAAELPH